MASQLLGRLKQRIASLELVPSSGGAFEIDLDGKRIYSKLETGSFPDDEEILRLVDRKAPA